MVTIQGNAVSLSELREDVIAAKEKGLAGRWALCPETVEALINYIEHSRAKLAQVEQERDEELGRWQESIRDEVIKCSGASDCAIDGSGCDSGDPLDLSLAEIAQGFAHIKDLLTDAEQDRDRLAAEVELHTSGVAYCPKCFAQLIGKPKGCGVHGFPNNSLSPIGAVNALRAQLTAAQQSAQVEWLDGEPPFPWCDEWFIAVTAYGDKVVLTALPKEHTYDYKTADNTYFKADKIAKWAQFPDSEYVPYVQQSAKERFRKGMERAFPIILTAIKSYRSNIVCDEEGDGLELSDILAAGYKDTDIRRALEELDGLHDHICACLLAELSKGEVNE